jgi:hypothetical protein
MAKYIPNCNSSNIPKHTVSVQSHDTAGDDCCGCCCFDSVILEWVGEDGDVDDTEIAEGEIIDDDDAGF